MKRPGLPIVAAAAATLPLLAAQPAAAQIDAGKLAAERTAHIRDMLRFMALGARRAGAFTFGKVEASADRGTVRIYNAVIVLRRYPLVYSIPLIEIEDRDRTHLVPFDMTLRAIGAEAEMGTIPQFVRGMMLALGVKHTRANVTLDYAYNQQQAALALKQFRLQWSDYASVSLSANLANVPTPNHMLALTTGRQSAEARLKRILVENWQVKVINKSAHEVLYRSAAFIRREDADTFRKRTLADFASRADKAQTGSEREFWRAAATVISGPAIATATGTAQRGVPIGALQEMETAKALEQRFRIRIDADEASVDAIAREMPDPKPAPWNPQAASVTDPQWHECDAVAADPADRRRKAEPVADAAMDPIVALAECKRAVMEYPAAPRFQFEYGRALWAAEHQRVARSYLTRASEAGYAAATYALAQTYLDPEAGTTNPTRAVELLRKAETQGSSAAKIALARAYLSGEGVEQDVEAGMKMLREGDLEEQPLGKAALADAYWNGWGEERDRKRAMTLYEEAAQNGLRSAQRRLADIDAAGAPDVEADPQKAYFWLRVLARLRAKAVREKIREIAPKIPAETRLEIEERARRWEPKAT